MQLCRRFGMVGDVNLAVICSLLTPAMLFHEGCMELGELARRSNRRRTRLIPNDGAIYNLGPSRWAVPPFPRTKTCRDYLELVGSDMDVYISSAKRDTQLIDGKIA